MKWFNKDFTVSLEWTSYRLTRSLRVLYQNATAQLIRETTSQLKSREINFVILVLDEMAKKNPRSGAGNQQTLVLWYRVLNETRATLVVGEC